MPYPSAPRRGGLKYPGDGGFLSSLECRRQAFDWFRPDYTEPAIADEMDSWLKEERGARRDECESGQLLPPTSNNNLTWGSYFSLVGAKLVRLAWLLQVFREKLQVS